MGFAVLKSPAHPSYVHLHLGWPASLSARIAEKSNLLMTIIASKPLETDAHLELKKDSCPPFR